MKMKMMILILLPFMGLGGCATIPTGPSVQVMPGSGKSFEQFQADDAVCRQWARQQIGQSPQETINQNTSMAKYSNLNIGHLRLDSAMGIVIAPCWDRPWPA